MKKIGAGLLLCFISFMCFSNTIEWQLTRNSNVYKSDAFSNYSFSKELKKGSVVNGSKPFVYSYNSPEYTYLVIFDNDYYTDAEAVIPNGTKDLFDETLLTATLHRQGKNWFSVNHIEILKSQDRNFALQQVPNGTARYIKNMDEFDRIWYEYRSEAKRTDLFQVTVALDNYFNGAIFYILAIEKKENAYRLLAQCDLWWMHDTEVPQEYHPQKEDIVVLTVYPDGDYLDIYFDDRYLLGSYATMDSEFEKQFETLMETNTCDLTNVTFPRRADKNHSVGTSCIVAENLRLRKEESTSSATLHTMKAGTKVTILQLGKQQTIDGITANWVQVQLADGTKGWCFGGYLTTVPAFEPTPQKVHTEDTAQPAQIQQHPEQNTNTVILLFIVIGGIVLLAIVISAVVILTQKKQKK